MYNSGAAHTSDFFALEILDGYLFLLLDLGSGATKVKVTQGRVSDGLQHLLLLEHNGKSGTDCLQIQIVFALVQP